MANELLMGWTAGATLTANVLKNDGSVRELGIGLDENPTGGLYIGDCPTIRPGDIEMFYEGATLIGVATYKPVHVEGAYTIQDVLRLLLAVLAGKSSGGGGDTITFRDTADTVDRLVVTVDTSGNRSGVVLDVT